MKDMENEKKPHSLKSSIIRIAILIFVFAAITAVIIFELDHYHIIDLDYKPKYLDIAPEDLGSAKKLEGRTAMVTVFASDKCSKWDFTREESVKRRRDFLDYTKVAADWLTEQGKRYGKELEFRFAADENDSLLYYEYDFMKVYDTRTAYTEWDYIEKNIDSAGISAKLGCDNIVYYFYLNYHEENDQHSLMLMTYDKPLEKPYEIVWIPYQKDEDVFKEPISIAHETLHTFGAPDYYVEKSDLYDTNTKFYYYCRDHLRRDIMFVTGGVEDRPHYYDRIDAEITDITAYYLGWRKNAPWPVDHYKLIHCQFERDPNK